MASLSSKTGSKVEQAEGEGERSKYKIKLISQQADSGVKCVCSRNMGAELMSKCLSEQRNKCVEGGQKHLKGN